MMNNVWHYMLAHFASILFFENNMVIFNAFIKTDTSYLYRAISTAPRIFSLGCFGTRRRKKITNSPILLWLFHLHLVHYFVSFAHTQTCLASLHLIPSQFLLPYGHVLPICLKGRHDENASLLVRCTAAQSRALHMTGSTTSSRYCSFLAQTEDQTRRATSITHSR